MRMSLSWTVARPVSLGLISSHLLPFSYLRDFMSDLVERLNSGCSIEAMSPLGTASMMSQTNRSSSYRFGNKLLRWLFVISHTQVLAARIFRHITHHTIRHITHQLFVISHTIPFVISHTKSVISHTKIRHITHQPFYFINIRQVFMVQFGMRNSLLTYLTRERSKNVGDKRSHPHEK